MNNRKSLPDSSVNARFNRQPSSISLQLKHSKDWVVCFAILARPTEAVVAYDRALAIHENVFEAWSDRAAPLINQNKLQDAIDSASNGLLHASEPREQAYVFATRPAAHHFAQHKTSQRLEAAPPGSAGLRLAPIYDQEIVSRTKLRVWDSHNQLGRRIVDLAEGGCGVGGLVSPA